MRRSRKTKKNADLIGYLIMSIVIVIMIVAGYFFFQAKSEFVHRDDFNCREDGIVSKETAIVIDATDSLNETQILFVNKKIKMILENSLLDEKVSFYILNNNEEQYSPRLSLCNSGDGKDKSELTSNKRRLKKQWNENFYNKIIDEVNSVVDAPLADSSPVLEMIKFVSINTMYESTAKEKRILLVSDMLHHTKQYSQYKTKPSPKDLDSLPYLKHSLPKLHDVDVEVLYVLRPNFYKLQTRGHIDFWDKYIQKAGGNLVHVESIN